MSLASADVVTFERTARTRIDELVAAGIDRHGLRSLLEDLENSSLQGFEVARRTERIAALLPMSAAPVIAATAADSGPEVRSALVGALPAQFQRGAYVRDDAETGPKAAAVESPGTDTPEQDVERGAEGDRVEEDDADGWRAVLLLGGARESTANAVLLESHPELKAVRVPDLSALHDLAHEPICGLVVHASWWNQFGSVAEIVDFVGSQITRSNLAYVKIDFRNLEAASEPVAALIESLDSEVRTRVDCSEGSRLTAADLRTLEGVSARLRSAWGVRVGVEGIDDADRQLLAAAIAAFARAKHLPRVAEEERLSVKALHEGRSGADVLAIRSEAYGLVVVAKLDDLSALQDELERARSAMPATWLTAGDLALYSLRDRGVLLQRLLVDLNSPEHGAPSLRERLRDCVAWERGRAGVPEPEVAQVCEGVDRLVNKVVEMNRTAENQVPSLGWMDAAPLGRLSGLSVRWQVGKAGEEFDPATRVDRARDVLASHHDKRVVHGDLHTGNALMPDVRTPDLIDFAKAGSGHPCFDLVRIGSAVAYEFMRQLDSESRCSAFFGRLHVEGASKSELEAEFPDLLAGIGAQVALHTLVVCRTKALAAIGETKEEAQLQYLAMVYLIAAQSLTIEDFQEGIVRSALAAVGPSL